jgi:hypothetical protein
MARRWTLAAAAFALVSALAALWPAASSPTDTIICNFVHPDCLSNHWLLVWVAEQVRHGASILHNDRYYWPVGDAPWLAGNGSEGFLYLPFHLLFGWPLGSNVYLVGILTLNGIAAYTLARANGASPAASLAAAPTGALLLYAVHEMGAGRFTQVSVCWFAFFLASWVRLLDRPTLGGAVLSAALLGVTSFFYWYYGFFGVLAGATLLLSRAGALRRREIPVRTLLTFAATYLVLVAPLLWVFYRYWASIPGTGEDQFPHPESVGDSTWPGIPFLVNSGRHAGRALPFTTVVLAFVALTVKERRRQVVGLWLVVLLFAGLMAGALVPHGPYELVYGLARPLRRFWWPYRHVVGINLGLTALAAIGAERLVRGRFGGVVAVGLALSIPAQLTLQDAPWHAQFSKADLSDPFYTSLADAPGTILVEPPLAPALASAQTPLIYQLQHKKTLLAGHALWVDRVRPAAWDAMVASNSFLTAMQQLELGQLGDTFRFDPADLRTLIDAGARTWVVNHEYFPVMLRVVPEDYELVFTALFGPPTATGKRVKAWDAGSWDGSTAAVPITPVVWPAGLHPGGPTLAIQSPRPPSIVFSMPAPPKKMPDPPKGSPPGGGHR